MIFNFCHNRQKRVKVIFLHFLTRCHIAEIKKNSIIVMKDKFDKDLKINSQKTKLKRYK